jgi:hypothetical protein
MVGFTGVKAIETSAGAVTVSLAVPEIEPEEGEMTVVPCKRVDDKPAVLTEATVGTDDFQVEEVVTFCVL